MKKKINLMKKQELVTFCEELNLKCEELNLKCEELNLKCEELSPLEKEIKSLKILINSLEKTKQKLSLDLINSIELSKKNNNLQQTLERKCKASQEIIDKLNKCQRSLEEQNETLRKRLKTSSDRTLEVDSLKKEIILKEKEIILKEKELEKKENLLKVNNKNLENSLKELGNNKQNLIKKEKELNLKEREFEKKEIKNYNTVLQADLLLKNEEGVTVLIPQDEFLNKFSKNGMSEELKISFINVYGLLKAFQSSLLTAQAFSQTNLDRATSSEKKLKLLNQFSELSKGLLDL